MDVRDVVETAWSPVDHRVENMTTARLDRCEVAFADGGTAKLFVKVVQPAWKWPGWEEIPEQFRPMVLADIDHRDEPRIYRSGIGERLPAPLRMPIVWHVEEREESIELWLEDVADSGTWDLDRYHEVAAALGRFSAAFDQPVLEAAGWRGRDFRNLFYGKIVNYDLAILRTDEFWEQPAVRAAADDRTRDDLEWLAGVMPARLDRLPTLPQVAMHGDATPDNFRLPGDGTIVAIDWSFASWAPPGSDLGQLFIGRFETGAADVDDAPAILETIVDGYLAGAEGRFDRATVEEAFATTLAVRSLFSALVVDHRPDLDAEALHDLTVRRGRVARVGLDLARRTGP